MNELAKEIDEFLAAEPEVVEDIEEEKTPVEDEVPPEEPVETETPTEDEPAETEVVETTEEEVEGVKPKAEETKDEIEEETPVEEDTVETLRKTIDDLQGKITELGGKAPKEEVPEEVEEAVEEAFKGYLDGKDIDEVITKPEVLEGVFKAIEERARETSVTRVLQSIPGIVLTYIQRQTQLIEASKEFYKENEDLAGARQTVGAFANEVAAENPDWTLDKVLEETAIRTRKALRLKLEAKPKGEAPKKERNPALVKEPKKGGDRKPGPKLTGLQKEINDLLT